MPPITINFFIRVFFVEGFIILFRLMMSNYFAREDKAEKAAIFCCLVVLFLPTIKTNNIALLSSGKACVSAHLNKSPAVEQLSARL
jgi:hypothetical protein